MNLKFLLPVFVTILLSLTIDETFAEIQNGGFGDSPFERDFGDVKFLDAYFGTLNQKIEIESGDKNVPFTVVFANVGSQDITGIRGQLLLPPGFSSSDGLASMIRADSDSNSLAGEHFHLTFFVNIEKNVEIQQYPATIKVDYSRLRESGIRTSFTDFDFKITGDSIINAKAVDPFLTSLKFNDVIIQILNDGTALISNVDIIVKNTETSTTTNTNIDNVMIMESNWNVGNIEPKSLQSIPATIYVPENLKDDTLRIPLSISYYNAQGDKQTVEKIVDFFVKGLIELRIFNVNVIELSGTQMVIGEIINEGNEDGLFGFVTIDSRGSSNIKSNTQFIDEIEIDAPVPFNLPIEFDGEPKYGEHEITITIRYKDSIRDEIFLTHDSKIFVEEPLNESDEPNYSIIIIPIAIILGTSFYILRKRKKTTKKTSD